MPTIGIQAALREITRTVIHGADGLLRTAIRLLTTTPAPLADAARQGALIALVLLVVGLSIRYLMGESGSLTVDGERRWGYRDTARMAAALAGLAFYYLHLDAAYSLLGTLSAPLGGGDALVTAMQIPSVLDTGSVMELFLALMSGQMVVMAALIGAMRTLIVMGILPMALPVLTVGALLRIPPLSHISREILRSLRWAVYAGIVAVFLIQFGGLATAAASDMGLPLASLICALATLNLTAIGMIHTFFRGPEIERRIERALRASSDPDVPHRHEDGDNDEDGEVEHDPVSEAEFV